MRILFQLTRPRGTRHNDSDFVLLRRGFNSRVRGGRDSLTAPNAPRNVRFNSRVRGGRDLRL